MNREGACEELANKTKSLYSCFRHTAVAQDVEKAHRYRPNALASMDRNSQLISFYAGRFIYLVQFRLLLDKKTNQHCPLGEVSFGVKHQLEALDIGLNDPHHDASIKSDMCARACLIDFLGVGKYVPFF
jgi:hypothetical protein